MRNYFILNGVDSRDFGVYISGQGTFSAPKKAYTYYNIPGRNGALLSDERRLENIYVSYEAFIYTNFNENLANFRSFLLSLNGYVKLTDSYHPDEYRMAAYEGPLDPDVTMMNDAGKFTITFTCKPQRFLYSGDTEYVMGDSIAGNPLYADTGNLVASSLGINISVPYENGTATSRSGYQYVVGVYLRLDDETIWTKTLSGRVIEAAINVQTGITVTKKVVLVPTTGWGKVTGYGSLYSVSFNPGGTILACDFIRYVGSSSEIGCISYNNGKLYIGAPANRTTLDSFYEWFNSYESHTLVVTASESTTWTDSLTLPSGYHELRASTMYANSSAGIMPNSASLISADVNGSGTELVNPSEFPSKPLIRIYGNGVATINGITITVTNTQSSGYVDVDCEMMDCYEGSTNRNNDVSFSTYDFPELETGTNTFTVGTGITEFRVIPRWWRV